MIDLRQLEYFEACVRTESFSEAAQQLYTTQPSVSRVIHSLEEEMGKPLFERHARGIRLTPAGQEVHRYAKQILAGISRLQSAADRPVHPLLRVSANASTWFSDRFLEFYEMHRHDGWHYQIYTAGTREIVERLRERTDDLGFVSVIEDQLEAFHAYAGRNFLTFEELSRTNVVLYYGRKGLLQPEEELDFGKLRLIQRFPEEYSAESYSRMVDEENHSIEEAETVVTTNSDYLMRKMLSEGDLANISGEYLTGDGRMVSESHGQMRLPVKNQSRMVFGFLKRKEEETDGTAEEFLMFMKNLFLSEKNG